MKSEDEIKTKLEELKSDQIRLKKESYHKPCKPDGSQDTKHIQAVSNQGGIGMLEWVLKE